MAHYVKIDPHFVLTEKNRFGIFLINSLRHKKEQEDLPHNYSIPNTVKLKIAIPEHYERNMGFIISERHQYRFNNYLYEEFVERMIERIIENNTGAKGDIRKNLLLFREKYQISEDELGYKTMEKIWERKNKTVKLCKSA